MDKMDESSSNTSDTVLQERKLTISPTSPEGRDLMKDFLVDQFSGDRKKDGIILLGLSTLGIVASALGLFVVLVPVTYTLGGHILHSENGWKMFQPGVGGVRFVALNGVGWMLYSISIIMTATNFFINDMLLSFAAFGVGLLSYTLIISSLLTYQNDRSTKSRPQVSVPSEEALRKDRTFNEELETSALLHNGERPTELWWLFIGMNSLAAMFGAWVAISADIHAKYQIIRLGAAISSFALIAGTTTVTYALGGQWRHLDSDFALFQPGKGGVKFVSLQALGWMFFSIGMLLAIAVIAEQLLMLVGGRKRITEGPIISVFGTFGFLGQLIVAVSLVFYEPPKSVEAFVGPPKSVIMDFLKKTQFLGLNILFSGGSTYEAGRQPKLSGPDDWELSEKKFLELTKEKCTKTGDQYLIIGVGFVGRRLVKRLLDRGETRIRLFDIVPGNPFSGDDRVEYFRGDVTKYEDVKRACQGVDTCYSTFAIIRFMDRLEHQAALSYRINIGGSENVIRACRESNVKRLIVTSSSHATTDEHSQPRLLRDENAPYVNRETAHNHYGWTKAAADTLCLNANGAPKADGSPLRVAIIRPCSGVFGGDDRISFEKAMDLTVFPGVGAKKIMDWVYVENVVLGHLLLEGAMQRNDPGVDGEAFNISNNEAVKNEDLWFSVMKIIDKYVHKEKVKSSMELIFVPESPLWIVAYISELNQKIFKGRVSLGKDLDMLTPGMMATATMEYSYNSDKAERVLGYVPAYTLDQGIQKSLYEYWQNKFPDKKTQ